MKPSATALLAFSIGLAAVANAQRAVPVANEPHHHMVYEDARLRVFRVDVPAYTSTMLHEHAVDYVWIAVGSSEFVNAVRDAAEVKVIAQDGSVHFTRGGFAHLARVEGAQAFQNITLELPQAQTNPRNLCEAVLPGEPFDCAAATTHSAAVFSGAGARPEFETDQVRVTLLTIAPGAKLALAKRTRPMVLVSVDDAAGSLPVTCALAGRPKQLPLQSRSGNTYRLTGRGPCSVYNATRSSVRFLALEFSAGTRQETLSLR
ncbi:MAG: hypothetical protein ACHQQR_10855 [Gemmatimonadales bacterium]